MARKYDEIEVDRIFLYEENPRHDPLVTEDEVIEHLCKDEQVYNLARDIATAGPNPLELLGLIELPTSGKGTTKRTYQVREGNRRVCAIKLLNDPDRAPPHLRKDLARLVTTERYTPIRKLPSIVFDDEDDLKIWMGVIHGGQQDGVGRRDWDAQQKERHFGSGRNKIALAVLDAAEALGLISKEDRGGKLTTAQRFLNSSVVREAIGIDATNKDDVAINRPFEDVKKQLGRFIADLKGGDKVTSRHNKDRIDAYGRKLAQAKNLTGERIQPLSLKTAATPTGSGKSKKSSKPKKPKKKDKIEYNKELARAIEAIGNDKLESLYYSLCDIRLEQHTPLLTIGTWAFVESLSAVAGRNADVAFCSFFSKQRLSDLGFDAGKKQGALREALQRISDNGNVTKHHEVAATFHGKQLANDLATITPLLLKTLESLPPKK